MRGFSGGGRSVRLNEASPLDERALQALPVGAATVLIGDGEPRIGACNPLFARALGAAGDAAPLALALRRHLATDEPRGSFSWQEQSIGGRHYQVHLAPMDPDRAGIERLMVTLVDRTAEIDTERSLRFEMLHDSLTGLPNRIAFAEALDVAMAAHEEDRHFAVIALDLARFSRINEGIGALTGDELVISVARRLVAALQPDDVIARTSGDEFGILITLTDGPGDALHVARRLRQSLDAPLKLSDLEIRVDCAIGCAVWQDADAGSVDVLRNAQIALKRAKRTGRIEVYQAEEARRARSRFGLETALRRAIDRDELHLAFQPLVALDGARLVGFEALARWRHPERGLITPDEFISVAEESGLIVPLGRWVLDKALGTLAAWDRAAGAPLPCYMSVNLSPVQLQRDVVAPMVAETLARHGIGGDRLTLELTESSIVADPARAATVLHALKTLRCRIAMDDFGTGYSNLAYLQRLPIDILKIDREFVTGMLDDVDAIAIVRAILSLASALGMATVAEGIEDQPLADQLRALGCDTGQGFHFARPLPADEALAYARQYVPGTCAKAA